MLGLKTAQPTFHYFHDVDNTSILGSYQGHYGQGHAFPPSTGWYGLRFGGQGGGMMHQSHLPSILSVIAITEKGAQNYLGNYHDYLERYGKDYLDKR